jgi:hypothetical protein
VRADGAKTGKQTVLGDVMALVVTAHVVGSPEMHDASTGKATWRRTAVANQAGSGLVLQVTRLLYHATNLDLP